VRKKVKARQAEPARTSEPVGSPTDDAPDAALKTSGKGRRMRLSQGRNSNGGM
jgi:hypothetical protein